MDDTTLQSLINIIPARFRGCALALFILAPHLGRLWSGLKSGGGIIPSLKSILFGSATVTPKATNDASSASVATKLGLFIGFAILSVSLFSGCSWVQKGNARLELGGAYAPTEFIQVTNSDATISTMQQAVRAPDFAFMEIDSSFDLAYSAIRGVFKFELDNRQWLQSVSPKIKTTLDQMRPGAWAVITKYTKARKAYMSNPTPAGLNTLDGLVGQVKTLVDIAIAVLPQNLSTKPVTN